MVWKIFIHQGAAKGVGTARSMQHYMTRGARRAMESHKSQRPSDPLLLSLDINAPQLSTDYLPALQSKVGRMGSQTKLELQVVKARPEAPGTTSVQAVLIKAVRLRASFTWLSSSVNHAMQHVRVLQNCLKAVEKHGHEGLNLEVERTKCPEEKSLQKCQGEERQKAYPFLLLKHRSSKR